MRRAPPDQESFLSTRSWTVPAAGAAVRLDAFVRRCLPHLSLRQIQKAIDEKNFSVNGRRGKKGDRLFGGEVVSLKGGAGLLEPRPAPAAELAVPILYEDDCVMVVDKPAGMATHGFSGREKRALANFLTAIRPSLAGVGKSRWEPGLVHRLDRDTSGVVLVAKDQAAFENLRSQFRRGAVKKKYWALVWGKVGREGVLADPLVHDPRDRRRMRALKMESRKGGRGKSWRALTRFKPLASAGEFTLLEVEIETGVTHQIRAHLEAFGCPVVGDPLYGQGRPDPFALGRQFLHAYHLGFRHPRRGSEVTVTAPLPRDLERVLEELKIVLKRARS